jgi:hypothetical protein
VHTEKLSGGGWLVQMADSEVGLEKLERLDGFSVGIQKYSRKSGSRERLGDGGKGEWA